MLSFILLCCFFPSLCGEHCIYTVDLLGIWYPAWPTWPEPKMTTKNRQKNNSEFVPSYDPTWVFGVWRLWFAYCRGNVLRHQKQNCWGFSLCSSFYLESRNGIYDMVAWSSGCSVPVPVARLLRDWLPPFATYRVPSWFWVWSTVYSPSFHNSVGFLDIQVFSTWPFPSIRFFAQQRSCSSLSQTSLAWLQKLLYAPSSVAFAPSSILACVEVLASEWRARDPQLSPWGLLFCVTQLAQLAQLMPDVVQLLVLMGLRVNFAKSWIVPDLPSWVHGALASFPVL